MRQWTARVARCIVVLLWAAGCVAHAAPQTGWYWNPNESGRGFFVESHDGITFVGAYLYDTDGHALWLVAGGANEDAYNYTGPLLTVAGGQTLFGDFVAPSTPASVGNITLRFTDDTHATITWPGGVVQVERQIFGTGKPPFKPQAGWWWNPDESGTGYSLEVQGSNLFVVGFMYEDSGRPVWYFSAGPMASDTTFHGDVVQFAGGQTMGGPYRPPGAPTSIATLDITFSDVDEATFTFTDGKSGIATSELKRKKGKSERKQFPTTPSAYVGRMQAWSQYSGDGTARWEINVDEINLVADDELVPLGKRGTIYSVTDTSMQITYRANLAGCIGQATAEVEVPASAITLTVYTDHTYQFVFNFPAFVVPGTLTCDGETTPFSVVFPGMQLPLTSTEAVPDHDLAGKRASWHISKSYDTGPGAVQAGGFWDFKPIYF